MPIWAGLPFAAVRSRPGVLVRSMALDDLPGHAGTSNWTTGEATRCGSAGARAKRSGAD
jgi:hypothetical protein